MIVCVVIMANGEGSRFYPSANWKIVGMKREDCQAWQSSLTSRDSFSCMVKGERGITHTLDGFWVYPLLIVFGLLVWLVTVLVIE